MKMNIKYIKDDKLAFIKSNSMNIYTILKESNDNKWIEEYLGDDYLGTSKINAEPLNFLMDKENPIDSDLDNALMLYKTFKHLNETQASDERFWVGLALTQGYDYLLYRWGLNDYTKFKYRWIYYTKNRRSLFYHGLARLWWFTKLTYDDTREDPYELTKFAYSYSEIMKNMVYRNYSSSDIVRKAILNALYKFQSENHKIIYSTLVDIYKFVNFLGGITLLDSYNLDELIEKIYDKLIENVKVGK